MDLIQSYWSDFFGIASLEMDQPGVTVLPHKALKGFNGAWIFLRKKKVVISIMPSMLGEIQGKIDQKIPSAAADYLSNEFIEYLFEDRIEKLVGPAFQGYYEKKFENNQEAAKIQSINFQTHKNQIFDLSQTGDEQGWNNSSIKENSEALFGYFVENQLVSIANFQLRNGNVGFIGVYTDPNFRGQGFGRAAVQAAVNHLINHGYGVLYQTLFSNKGSMGIAQKIGIKEYARHIAVRLKSGK